MNERTTASSAPDHDGWIAVCRYDDIVPDTGVCALVHGRHVAVFRVDGDDARVFAIDNVDPRAHASVLSRGLTGSLGGRVVVASPLYKQHYDLRTGECLEEPRWSVDAFDARVAGDDVMVRVGARGDA
ncbi:assimilatory nitrite reductase (NAD(P)H) small subunit [Paraburkholderia caballeronis]|uniref:nitrite reductase small subunit NirD n=1 Tax=Paraburkholderia caballeronis TaxID=416943 RepID=UPI001066629F|nr:nitrite reductase small subunit NirD [Paraburkholderia caballeronis]TDV35714.1 assimilatory nitrite reductase (NAD(P)H) small subunit [Paraburkholderia caballeronis]